jgi:hypothetical protein
MGKWKRPFEELEGSLLRRVEKLFKRPLRSSKAAF